MKISLNLLKQFVDLSGLSTEEIVHKLTFAGLEVEGVTKLAEASNLVIGEILSVEEHPNSDHLHILKVDEGPKYGIHQIVCGAPNVKVGLKVIVAREKAVLPRLGVTIQKSKIRDIESDGMCCSLVELGVDKTYLSEKQISGIEELDPSAPVGEEKVLKYLGYDDEVLDINVLANRSDCLAAFSLAKELASLFNRPLNIPTFKAEKLKESDFKVSSATSKCNQFSLKVCKDLKIKESPTWLKRYLMASNIRSINNIVDIGNYVMLLTGQPLHMYDIDKLPSREFIVKDDVESDFVALDEKTYQIEKGDLVVTNGGHNVCLAGVMGALECAVDDNSKNIAIEAAYFHGATIRKTTIKTGLSSDSSARFIKGINPNQDRYVLDLAVSLLKELADAKEIYETVFYREKEIAPTVIECSVSYINNRLGTDFEASKIKEILERLYCHVTFDEDQDHFKATIPSHRIDLKCDADLSEEVIRFVGFEAIKSRLPMMETTRGGLTFEQQKRLKIREMLIANGYNEILTYTLISPEEDQKFVLLNEDEPYILKNPMTVEHSVVRRSLIVSCLNTLKYNLDHQNRDLALFEVSEVQTKTSRYTALVAALNGACHVRGQLKTRPYDFYDLYGAFLMIMEELGIEESRYKVARLTSPYFHPGRSVKVTIQNQVVAVIGQIHPQYQEKMGETYVMEVNLSAFMALKVGPLKMKNISRYPSVSRDLALVVDKNVLAKEMIRQIKKSGYPLVSEVSVFDVYEGLPLEHDKKSLALSITYSDCNKTMTSEEIAKCEAKIISDLNNVFKAELRK